MGMERLFRDSPAIDLEVIGSKDSYIITKDNKKYLDFLMGWCVGNIGWNKKDIIKKIKSFDGPSYVLPDYKYERWDILAEKLISLMPNKEGTCFRATGGTESVELALKISKAYNKRKKFIAFNNAYHGQSFACMALVGLHEQKFGPYPDDYIRLPIDWDKAQDIAIKNIMKKDVCAFISEPIICNLGIIVPPKSFFESISEACKKTDTLFIIDEVATGFGRTGKWFGFEHYGLTPDIITIAKGFSSGYAPIGAAIANPKVSESMRFDFSNYSTFGWQPLSIETAIANIDYIKKNSLVEKAEKSGVYITKVLSEFCKPEGKGLCIALDTNNNNIREDCLNEGLIVSSFDNRLLMFPALDVKKKEIDKAVDIIKNNF
jgi:acetylornithine/succinyldiaminopimelate/putrescine aminotransferase